MAGATATVIAVTVVGGFLLFNGKNTPSAATLSAEDKQNIERKLDLNTIERSLVQYANTHANTFPTLSEINNEKFRVSSMAGITINVATDPIGRTAQFSGEPGAGLYHYAALPKGCDNQKVKCTEHKITATLSDGQMISMPQ